MLPNCYLCIANFYFFQPIQLELGREGESIRIFDRTWAMSEYSLPATSMNAFRAHPCLFLRVQVI